MMSKIVLAYSGGLDTSVILKWLVEKGHDVIAFIGDVGQAEDFEAIKKKALATGASAAVVADLKEELVIDYVFAAVKANAVYEGRYLLGTSLARPLIAKAQVAAAHASGAKIVAHGATGKGNDQVRFELGYAALNPSLRVFSPWKDPEFLAEFKGRPDLFHYAEKHGIEVKASKSKPYSEDANLIHISHESGILENPAAPAEENVYSWTVHPQAAPDKQTVLRIRFKDGVPVEVADLTHQVVKNTSLELFQYLNEVGAANGIGRVDMVENRFVGIKSRGVYETPGLTILLAAHKDIEGVAMDREVMRLRDTLTPRFAEYVYNGFWFSPEMDFLMAAINKSQEIVDGTVLLSLYKGNVSILGRESPSSLYDRDLSSMDIEGGFDQTDSKGFIAINAIRLKAHHVITAKQGRKVTDFLRNGK
ncbi:MAG: argininosuccinate synthase [Candidatus Aminicenantes bacterium]|nr:argininosuccinate synthase [Candidatus Aminicenantes bacterium]